MEKHLSLRREISALDQSFISSPLPPPPKKKWRSIPEGFPLLHFPLDESLGIGMLCMCECVCVSLCVNVCVQTSGQVLNGIVIARDNAFVQNLAKPCKIKKIEI